LKLESIQKSIKLHTGKTLSYTNLVVFTILSRRAAWGIIMSTEERNVTSVKMKPGKLRSSIITLVLLIALIVAGNMMGVFSGFGDVFGLIHVSVNTVLSLVIEIVFVIFLANILLMIAGKFTEKKEE